MAYVYNRWRGMFLQSGPPHFSGPARQHGYSKNQRLRKMVELEHDCSIAIEVRAQETPWADFKKEELDSPWHWCILIIDAIDDFNPKLTGTCIWPCSTFKDEYDFIGSEQFVEMLDSSIKDLRKWRTEDE